MPMPGLAVWAWRRWSVMADSPRDTDGRDANAGNEDARDSDPTFRILTVCTMNICRSPAMEVSLQDAAQACGADGPPIHVVSAGTHATPGAPSCDISLAHVGHASREQTARELTGALLAETDLVLTAERKHANAVASIAPQYGSIAFPVRMAARLAGWIVAGGSLDVAIRKADGEHFERDFSEPQTLVNPLPNGDVARLRWLVEQCDGARGLVPAPAPTKMPYGVDDIPDPHVLGFNLHELSAEMITAAISDLTAAVMVVLSAPTSA